MSILSFILFLIVAACCAYIAERLVPNAVPGGFFTTAIIGVLGAWIGSAVMGSFGPALQGVALLPCILGSAIFVFLFTLAARGFHGRSV